jgi:hypothetical protein
MVWDEDGGGQALLLSGELYGPAEGAENWRDHGNAREPSLSLEVRAEPAQLRLLL